MMRAFIPIVLMFLASCTPGGITPAGGASNSSVAVMTIDVNLAAFGAQQTPAGTGLGYAPEVTTVPVGSGVRFMNTDNTAHTASFVGGTSFPAQTPLGLSATAPSADANISSGDWTSGALQGGATSQVFFVDKPGTYLFGCFYHYSAQMRGEIVAQ